MTTITDLLEHGVPRNAATPLAFNVGLGETANVTTAASAGPRGACIGTVSCTTRIGEVGAEWSGRCAEWHSLPAANRARRSVTMGLVSCLLRSARHVWDRQVS